MSRYKTLILIAIFFVLVASGYFLYSKQEEKSSIYTDFVLEAYDSIQKNYWGKPEDYNLPKVFELSLEKILETVDVESPADKEGVRIIVEKALKNATSTEGMKDIALKTVAIALYNLEPIGRNALFSEKAEKDLRNNVANVNPDKNLYSDLGLEDKAPIDRVESAYESKIAEAKQKPAEERQTEIAKAEYAKSVLGESGSKTLYDEFKAEPTIFPRAYTGTLYLNISKIAPTTLWEFAYALNEASTTPNLSSLIIDFRDNVGGSLDFLPAFLGLFIGQDQYAFDLFSQGEKEVIRTTQPKLGDLSRYKDIVFLVSSSTQSTAELTADTFRRYNLGKVVGVTTRGWGTIENTFPLSTIIDPEEKYSLLIVHSLTVRGDNEPIEGRGVIPDVDTTLSSWKTQLQKLFGTGTLEQTLLKVVPLNPQK